MVLVLCICAAKAMAAEDRYDFRFNGQLVQQCEETFKLIKGQPYDRYSAAICVGAVAGVSDDMAGLCAIALRAAPSQKEAARIIAQFGRDPSVTGPHRVVQLQC